MDSFCPLPNFKEESIPPKRGELGASSHVDMGSAALPTGYATQHVQSLIGCQEDKGLTQAFLKNQCLGPARPLQVVATEAGQGVQEAAFCLSCSRRGRRER